MKQMPLVRLVRLVRPPAVRLCVSRRKMSKHLHKHRLLQLRRKIHTLDSTWNQVLQVKKVVRVKKKKMQIPNKWQVTMSKLIIKEAMKLSMQTTKKLMIALKKKVRVMMMKTWKAREMPRPIPYLKRQQCLQIA
uniref:Uncharacterized protein n=1 Tax=Cacopsylla melanoneura TaxID=428564 RepID=A0A8D9A1W5_9HEMI